MSSPATRKIVSITGSRADYGLMEPVHRAITADSALELHLIATGMHFLPSFASSLAEVRAQGLGTLHELRTMTDEEGATGMATAVGCAVIGMSRLLSEVKPDIVLLQGDRGEMLAGAIAAAHMNIPIVHMSGGDISGSVDDSLRNAISKLASFHLTNCSASTERLVAIGEARDRIIQVGEPGIDQLLRTDFLPLETLAVELELPLAEGFLLATLHPVTDEAAQAAEQMRTLLEAFDKLGLTTVFTYPNSDAGGFGMREVLESWRDKSYLRIVPNLGSRRYLSLLRHAAAVVGNSSSGLYDTPILKVPAVNIGSRQIGRIRAGNVVDVDFDRDAIIKAIRFVLEDRDFREHLAQCDNPFGDGHAAERAVDILKRLRLSKALTAKWLPNSAPFLRAVDYGL